MAGTDPTDNSYSASSTSEQTSTPTDDVVIKNAIDTMLRDLHTWLPAKVVLVKSPSMVSIQPLLLRSFKPSMAAPAGGLLPLPIIQNVPVNHPRGGSYSIKFPVAVGDIGIALFCERSLDKWLSGTGDLTDPADTRIHHLSDPIFIPGCYPFSNPVPPGSGSPTDLVLTNGLLEMALQKAGKFFVKNEDAELMDMINQLITLVLNMNTQLVAATTNTVLGPQPLNNAAIFAQYLEETTELQTEFLTMKGQ